MKRGAEAQLSKDHAEDEDNDVDPGTGFTKADDNILATRKIRALPKRLGGGAPAAPVTATPPPAQVSKPPFGGFGGFGGNASASTDAPKSAFGGFSGFGSSGTAPSKTGTSTFTGFGTGNSTNAFTFNPPAKTSSSMSIDASPQPPNPFPTTSRPAEDQSIVMSDPTSGPPLSSTATAGAKSFASMLSSSTTPASPTQPATNGSAAKSQGSSAELKYFKSLRGLNLSILAALQKEIDSDPFVDVGHLLDKYNTFRVTVQEEFDASNKPSSTAALSNTVSAPTAPAKFTMPVAPTSFGSFAPKPSTPSTSSSIPIGGFTPKLDSSTASKSSVFSFGGSTTAAAESNPTEKPSSAFGSSNTTSDTSKSSFSLGTSAGTGAMSTSSAFGNADASSSVFRKPKDTTKEVTTSPASGGTSHFSGSPKGLTPTSGTPFSFAGSPSAASSSFTFGKTGTTGTLGNPVGWGFGSTAKGPDDADASAKPAASNPFGFGAPMKAPVFGGFGAPSASAGEASKDTIKEEGNTGEEAPSLFPPAVHDEEGEGEEDEETMHSTKAKVFKMGKKKDENGIEKSSWLDLGVGVLRLKKHKEDNRRRMLLRNSSTGKIVINFFLYDGLAPTQDKTTVAFIGRDDEGKPVSFNVRVKTPAQAVELKAAIEREAAMV